MSARFARNFLSQLPLPPAPPLINTNFGSCGNAEGDNEVTCLFRRSIASHAMASSNVPEVMPSTVHLNVAVFGASVHLPVFDKVEAETWFAVADANFALRKVTDSLTKYYYILSKLDASTLRKLSSFIKQPQGDDPYREIKEVLCDAYELPLEQKLEALLELTDIGNDRPKEFGLEMLQLASDASRDDIQKRIYVRCLPQRVVTAITGKLDESFEKVIAAADRAWTAAKSSAGTSSASVSAISGSKASSARGARNGRGGR